MSIELPKEAYQEAIASLQRYARENIDEEPGEMGNIAAAGLLDFFLEEIAPLVYNRAVADVQERLQIRIAELDIEIHEDEFQYWPRRLRPGKPRR
jgi:uncharacterized protein (DUF2164 family)